MKKRGQIWVETVIYTLIGLALIGLVLAITTPRINEAKDRIAVEQTISSLIAFDNKITEALDRGPGNIRIIDFTMRRGELYINPLADEILFVIKDLSKPYSEPGVPIEFGRVTILSEEGQKESTVSLILSYANTTDLTFAGGEESKKFSATSTPYKFFIRNLGDVDTTDDNYLFVLDITEGSAGGVVSGDPGECVDNDGDSYNATADCGLMDCDDSNSEVNPEAEEVCGDGIDNDCDELPDCDDPDCDGNAACPGSTACSDNIDNDGDNLTDFPEDAECTDASDDSEYAPNLIAHYTLDNDFNDFSGNGNTGTESGGGEFNPGGIALLNGAYQFDGLDGFAILPAQLDMGAGDFTIALRRWHSSLVFVDPILQQMDGEIVFALDKDGTKCASEEVYTSIGGGPSVCTGMILETTVPSPTYHIAVTYNSASQVLTFYRDGVVAGTVEGVTPIGNSADYIIASDKDNLLFSLIQLDEIRFYDRELSQPEIEKLYLMWAL